MTARVTNGIRSEWLYQRVYNSTGGFVEYKTATPLCLGDYKSISTTPSEQPGSFEPGRVLRLNPVVIKSGSGVCTPGFRGRSVYHPTYGRQLVYSEALAARSGPVYTAPSAWGIWDQPMANEALNLALANVNEASAEVGVMLMELKQTLDLIRHPLRSLVKNLGKLARARNMRRRLSGVATTAADAHLMTRYGIIPLISDIVALQFSLASVVRKDVHALRRNRGTIETASDFVYQDGTYAYGSQFCRRYTTIVTTKTVTGVVYYQHLLGMEGLSKLSKFGVSPEQLLTIGWELIPYSFVVDWFLNVGTWLRAISPNHSILKKGACVSQKTEITWTINELPGFYQSVPNLPDDLVKPSTYVWKSSTLERRIMDPTATALPSFGRPHKVFLRSLDALALLWGRGLKRL